MLMLGLLLNFFVQALHVRVRDFQSLCCFSCRFIIVVLLPLLILLLFIVFSADSGPWS